MADLIQDINGKWKISGIKHDKNGVDVGAEFIYNRASTSFTITTQELTVETSWETPLGVPIDLNDITRNYTTPTPPDGKVYRVVDTNLVAHEYPNVTREIKIAYADDQQEYVPYGGNAQLKATYYVKIGGTVSFNSDVTDKVEWGVSAGPGSISETGLLTNTNQTENDQTIYVTAEYHNEYVEDDAAQFTGKGIVPTTYENLRFGRDNTETITSIDLDTGEVSDGYYLKADIVSGGETHVIDVTDIGEYTLSYGSDAPVTFTCSTTGVKYNQNGLKIEYGDDGHLFFSATGTYTSQRTFTLKGTSHNLEATMTIRLHVLYYSVFVDPSAPSERQEYTGSLTFKAKKRAWRDGAPTENIQDITNDCTWTGLTGTGSGTNFKILQLTQAVDGYKVEWKNVSSSNGTVSFDVYTGSTASGSYKVHVTFNVAGTNDIVRLNIKNITDDYYHMILGKNADNIPVVKADGKNMTYSRPGAPDYIVWQDVFVDGDEVTIFCSEDGYYDYTTAITISGDTTIDDIVMRNRMVSITFNGVYGPNATSPYNPGDIVDPNKYDTWRVYCGSNEQANSVLITSGDTSSHLKYLSDNFNVPINSVCICQLIERVREDIEGFQSKNEYLYREIFTSEYAWYPVTGDSQTISIVLYKMAQKVYCLKDENDELYQIIAPNTTEVDCGLVYFDCPELGIDSDDISFDTQSNLSPLLPFGYLYNFTTNGKRVKCKKLGTGSQFYAPAFSVDDIQNDDEHTISPQKLILKTISLSDLTPIGGNAGGNESGSASGDTGGGSTSGNTGGDEGGSTSGNTGGDDTGGGTTGEGGSGGGGGSGSGQHLDDGDNGEGGGNGEGGPDDEEHDDDPRNP